MTPANHPYDFEAVDGSDRRLHPLKAPCRADDLLECSMIRFDHVVQVLARAMLCRLCQLAFPLQRSDGVWIRSKAACCD